MEDKLRWGLISTANINRVLIPVIRASERSELVAVASRDQARAEAYADEWEIPRAVGSYEDLLADPEIDVVYISLPNSLHAEWTVKAADAGKHVLCEKPLALTVEEVDRMMEAAARNDVVVFEAFMYLHHPQTIRVLELIRGGEVGEVRFVRGSFAFSLDRPEDIRLEPELGGGALWDVGCYPVSFIRAVAGEMPELIFGGQRLGTSGVDMTFAGQFRFAGDLLCQFDCSFEQPFHWIAEVVGTKGRIVIDAPWIPGRANGASPIRLFHGDEEERVEVEEANPYRREVEAMADCVLEGAQPVLPLSTSREHIRMLVALYESAESGLPVTL